MKNTPPTIQPSYVDASTIVTAPSLPPNTTEQEDITTASQRKINLVWEMTQSIIAIIVTFSTMGVAAYLAITGRTDTLPTIFSVGFGVVTGFYFARTNHQAIGGIGRKANEAQIYKGR